MGIFCLYFTIGLIGLLIRGYYRLPSTCLLVEGEGKEEESVTHILTNISHCRCHYTNFLWEKSYFNETNYTYINENERSFEPLALILNLSDGLTVFGAMIYIFLTIKELSYQNFQLDSFIYVNDPTRILFLFSCLLTIAMLPARFTCSLEIDDVLCVFATLTRAPYFFFFCR